MNTVMIGDTEVRPNGFGWICDRCEHPLPGYAEAQKHVCQPAPPGDVTAEGLRDALEKSAEVVTFAAELCEAVDLAAEDIGGHRRHLDILRDIGCRVDSAMETNKVALAGAPGVAKTAPPPTPIDAQIAAVDDAIAALREKVAAPGGTVVMTGPERDALQGLEGARASLVAARTVLYAPAVYGSSPADLNIAIVRDALAYLLETVKADGATAATATAPGQGGRPEGGSK